MGEYIAKHHIPFNGRVYAPGDRVQGLTEKSAKRLLNLEALEEAGAETPPSCPETPGEGQGEEEALKQCDGNEAPKTTPARRKKK